MTNKIGISEILKRRDKTQSNITRKKMLLAKKIYDALNQKGLKQKDFADLIGKNQSEVSKWLSGDHNFTIETLFEIEKVIGINIIDVGDSVIPKNITINFKREPISQFTYDSFNLGEFKTMIKNDDVIEKRFIENVYPFKLSA